MVRLKPWLKPEEHHGHPEGHSFEFDEAGRMHVEALRVPAKMTKQLRIVLALIIAASLWNLYDVVDTWLAVDDMAVELEAFYMPYQDDYPEEFLERDGVRFLGAFLTFTAWLLLPAMIVMPARYGWLLYRVPYGHPIQYRAMLTWAWIVVAVDGVRLLMHISLWIQDFEAFKPGFYFPFSLVFGIVMLSMLYRQEFRFYYGAFRIARLPLQSRP